MSNIFKSYKTEYFAIIKVYADFRTDISLIKLGSWTSNTQVVQ